MPIQRVIIQYDRDGKLDFIQIAGRQFRESDGVSEPNAPTTGKYADDRIVIYEGSTCVWRNGRKYCG